MRHKKNLLATLIFFAFLFTFQTVIFAQEELTQTFTSANGKFSMSYPAGWTATEEDGLVRFNGSAGFLQVSFYDNNTSGYAPVTPMELLEVGIGEDQDLRAAMGYSEPEELVIAGYPALTSRSDDMGQYEAVIDFGDGVIATAIGFGQAGQLAASEPVFKAMIESIHYGDGPKPIVKSSLDDIKPITAANAANVTQLMTLGDETIAVESVAFSPDGKFLAVGTSDGNVQLWDVAKGESQMVLKGHTGGASSVAFGSGGYSIAVGTGSGQVRLWDATSGEGLGFLQKHDSRVESVAFLADGFLVASGAVDGSVKLWDIAAGSEQATLAESSGTPVGGVAFSPDGATLAVGGGNTIQLWDVASGNSKATLQTEVSEISSLSFQPDGKKLVYGGSNTAAWIWDLKDDNHALLEGHDNSVLSLAYTPDGGVIASGDAGMLRLWNATGENLAAFKSPSGKEVGSVAFNPDGTLLASGGASGGVVLWGTTADSASSQATTTSGNTDETGSATTEETATSAATSACSITTPKNANLRSGPGTEFDRAGTLSGGQTAEINGQANGSDGFAWYRLANGAWVRSDVIGSPAECANVPLVTP